MQPEQQAGNIFLPDPSVDPKIEEFLEEASGFPGAPYDDEVDAMTQAINWIRVRRKAFGLLEFMKVEAQKREQEKATTGVT
jgi:phage terminase large subunit-like protein